MQYSQRALATAFLALVGFANSLAFGNVLTVAPTGANYTQIQAAVNAASSDDVILMSPGSYGAVTIDGKSLTLCATGVNNVSILGTTTVKNLTASQRVILSGLKGLPPATALTTLDTGVGLVVLNNAGNVRIEYCSFFGAIGWGDNTSGGSCCDTPPGGFGRNAATLRNNAQGVSFTACQLQGGRGANAYYGCYCGTSLSGGHALHVISTLASLYDCTCLGGRGGNNGTTGGRGGTGCRTLSGGTMLTGVFASGSFFVGGGGGDATDIFPFMGGTGGDGMLVDSATGAYLMNNNYTGGPGGTVNMGLYPPGAPGFALYGGGSIVYASTTRLRLTADRFARAGSVVDVSVQGTSGQNIRLIASWKPTFQIMASWRGTLLTLSGKGSVDVPLGTIPASSLPANGLLHTRYVVPPLPAGVASASVFIQAYRFDPVQGPQLAGGTCITLLP